MNLKDFRLGWRLLKQDLSYSAIMILSLAIGFAVSFLVMAYTYYEISYDKTVPQLGQVYVVKARANWDMAFWSENVAPTIRDSLVKQGLPGSVTAVMPYPANVAANNIAHNLEITIVDPDFAAVFGVAAQEGDLREALTRPDSLALTVDTAQTVFGDSHALGKEVVVNGRPYRVAAIMARQPVTSSVQFQLLAGRDSGAWTEPQRKRAAEPWRYFGDNNVLSAKVYLRLPDRSSIDALLHRAQEDVNASALRGHLTAKNLEEVGTNNVVDIAFGPLADSYLDSSARTNSGTKGDLTTITILNAIAMLLLALTIGNYINLATIRTIQRQREVAMRKVLGASPARLVGQMLAESVVVAWAAALIGAVLATLLLPAWSDLSEHDMMGIMKAADWLAFAAIALAMGTLVGILGGLYPAWVVLKMRPSEALGGRGNSETAGGYWLRKVLTVLQFGIGIFVTGMIIAIGWQIHHLKNIDYGYQLDSLLTIILPEDLSATQVRSFQEALMRRPEIKNAAGLTQWPATVEYKNQAAEKIELPTLSVSPEYFATIGLPVVAGRLFDPKLDAADGSGSIVIDAIAARRLGFADADAAVGQLVDVDGKTLRIIGISKGVSRGFMHGAQKPIVYQIADKLPQLTVNGGDNLPAAQQAIEQVWRQYFPSYYLELNNARAMLERNAGGPEAVLQTCIIVAVITIPLAVFSIYILSSYAVQRRAREIVIRKLYGARQADIASLLMREFFVLTGIAALVALPLIFLLGRVFIQQFSDQAPVGIWAACAALAGAIMVVALASARHVRVAMRMSPAVALRTD